MRRLGLIIVCLFSFTSPVLAGVAVQDSVPAIRCVDGLIEFAIAEQPVETWWLETLPCSDDPAAMDSLGGMLDNAGKEIEYLIQRYGNASKFADELAHTYRRTGALLVRSNDAYLSFCQDFDWEAFDVVIGIVPLDAATEDDFNQPIRYVEDGPYHKPHLRILAVDWPEPLYAAQLFHALGYMYLNTPNPLPVLEPELFNDVRTEAEWMLFELEYNVLDEATAGRYGRYVYDMRTCFKNDFAGIVQGMSGAELQGAISVIGPPCSKVASVIASYMFTTHLALQCFDQMNDPLGAHPPDKQVSNTVVWMEALCE